MQVIVRQHYSLSVFWNDLMHRKFKLIVLNIQEAKGFKKGWFILQKCLMSTLCKRHWVSYELKQQ